MKLVCPHCSKVVDIPDQLGGQTTNCPQCQGPFTVPMAPPNSGGGSYSAATPPPSPIPPPPPPPPPPDPLGQTTDWRTRGEHVVPPLREGYAPAPPRSRAGRLLQNIRAIQIPPWVKDWCGVGTLVLLFLLTFFPWASISAGQDYLMKQSGAGLAFGTVRGDTTAQELFRSAGLGTSPLLVLYFLCVLAGLLLLIVLLLERYGDMSALDSVRPTLQRIADVKETIVLGLTVVTALILLLYLVGLPFPIEQLMQTEPAADVMRLGLKQKVSPEVDKVLVWDMVYFQWLRRHGWFYLATLINVVAAAYVLVKWLKHKGYIRQWPRLVMQWADDSGGADSPQLTFDAPQRG
jgi:hypothetical protein